MKEGEKVGLHSILSDLKTGLSQKEISEKYSMPKQTVSYNVGKLIKLKCVEKVGHGISSSWKFLKDVQVRPEDTLKVKVGLREIKGHAFIWNIEFVEEGYDWKQIIENYKRRYKKPALSFKMICGGKVPRTIFKGRKIWLTKKGLTIYEPLNFFGRSSFTVKGTAVFEMDRLIKDLLEVFKLKLQHYRFKCSREHFSHVNNQIARQFNDRKQRIKVEFDGKFFWIDHSDGVDEEETNDPNISVAANKFYKSQVKTGFKVTPEVVLDTLDKSAKQIKENAENFEEYADNIKSHIAAIKSLGAGVKEQNKIFREIRDFMGAKK